MASSTYEQRTATIESSLLGCHIKLHSDNSLTCMLLGESLIAALEAFLSTMLADHVVAIEPELTIYVRKTDFGQAPFSLESTDNKGQPEFRLLCAEFNPHKLSKDEQEQMRAKLLECISQIVARVFPPADPEQVFTKLFRDERAQDRALCFTSSFVTLPNVFGTSPKFTMDAWINTGTTCYPIRRNEAWDAPDRNGLLDGSSPGSKFQKVEQTLNKTGPSDRLKHTEIETVSLIRRTLWDQAKWSGTAFLFGANMEVIPVMALLFENKESAAQIFSSWRDRLGKQDDNGLLRISIIRHISKSAPHFYRIVVGMNRDIAFSNPKIKQVVMLSRVNQMEPASSENLTRFLDSYEKFRCYFLTYAILSSEHQQPKVFLNDSLRIEQLNVREAWEIGLDDSDFAGICFDDDPIIPGGIKDPPVYDVIKWLKSRVRA